MKDSTLNIRRISCIILGTLLIAIATNGILIPQKLLSGGVSGMAMLLYFLFGTKVSLMIILLNIPLFILGLFYLKKTYLMYSLFGMLMLSFWLEVTANIHIPVGNELSILVVGGLIQGIGTGIIFRADGCTGGTDIISKIIHKYFSINMATTNLCINALIIILSAYFFGLDMAVLTISTMFIASHVTNFAVDGINRKRTLYIVTDGEHFEKLSSELLQRLHRGVTVIPAIGAYTSKPKYILFTTVGIREVAKAKQVVLDIDPKAFMTVTETSQAIGNGKGFMHLEKSMG